MKKILGIVFVMILAIFTLAATSTYQFQITGTWDDDNTELYAPAGHTFTSMKVENQHLTDPVYFMPGYVHELAGYSTYTNYPTPRADLIIETATSRGNLLRRMISPLSINAASDEAADCVLTVDETPFVQAGDTVYIEGVLGMTQLNNVNHSVKSVDTGAKTVTLETSSVGYSTYTSGGDCYLKGLTITNHNILDTDGKMWPIASSAILGNRTYLNFLGTTGAPDAGTYDVVWPKPVVIPALQTVEMGLSEWEDLYVEAPAAPGAVLNGYVIATN